jgi:hypothetical protein
MGKLSFAILTSGFVGRRKCDNLSFGERRFWGYLGFDNAFQSSREVCSSYLYLVSIAVDRSLMHAAHGSPLLHGVSQLHALVGGDPLSTPCARTNLIGFVRF